MNEKRNAMTDAGHVSRFVERETFVPFIRAVPHDRALFLCHSSGSDMSNRPRGSLAETRSCESGLARLPTRTRPMYSSRVTYVGEPSTRGEGTPSGRVHRANLPTGPSALLADDRRTFFTRSTSATRHGHLGSRPHVKVSVGSWASATRGFMRCWDTKRYPRNLPSTRGSTGSLWCASLSCPSTFPEGTYLCQKSA